MAVREILKYPGVQSITLVELDPAMTRLFTEHATLVQLNGHALTSPKVKVVNKKTGKSVVVRVNDRGQVELREGCTIGTAIFPPFEASKCNGPNRWLDADFSIEVPQGLSFALVHARAGAGVDDPPRSLAVRIGEASTNLEVHQRISSDLRYLQFLIDLHGEPGGIKVRSISATYDCKF